MPTTPSRNPWQFELVPGGHLVRFLGPALDETTTPNLAALLFALAPERGAGNLILDFGAVDIRVIPLPRRSYC